MEYSKSLEEFYSKLEKGWKKEMITNLRSIILETGLEEKQKWGIPVFVWNKKNIIGIAAFKNHCAIWFYQGCFLKDEDKVLYNAQEGVTKALRQWRFSENENLDRKKIKSYVLEAIQNQKDGKEIKPQRKRELKIEGLLFEKLNKDEKLKKQFESLPLSKQREYAEYISSAKREHTKTQRMEKIILLILDGKGLYDKYKNC